MRTVAAFLDIDQALLSEMERGKRSATRAQVLKLASYFEIAENDLLVAWLSDKFVYEVTDEDMAIQALRLAEEIVSYNMNAKTNKISFINLIKTVLKNDGRVAAAWLFGFFARGEEKINSDVDIMIELKNNKKKSLFDLLDISFLLEATIKKKVDLVKKGYLKDFALETASSDLIKIYG